MIGALVDDHTILGRDVTAASPSDLSFHGRAVALRRALDNLVENAAVHGRDGGHVCVSLADGAALARAVKEALGVRSAHKRAGSVRVVVDPRLSR